MPKPIIVVGHKNPDNDSISAAVGYAYLKNQLAKRASRDEVYIPARLGPLPPESKWVLEENGIEPPILINHVHTRVSDVMTPDPISIGLDASMLEAGRLLRQHNIRSLVVEDDDGRFKGLISTRAIAERYMAATDAMEPDSPESSMAVAASLIESLSQKVSELMFSNVMELEPEDVLRDVVDDMIASELREAVVTDGDGRALGIVTRSDVATPPKRRVILVDHNEVRQAAAGIEEADVMEILDHHRIADVSTTNPIKFINRPIGSAASIVTMEFQESGVDIPPAIARVLLSAIMTDTVILKSPTATDTDRELVEYLANFAGVEPEEFGLQVFRARGGDADMSVKEIVEADSKEFQIDDSTILIGQHETVDLPCIMEREEEIRTHMRKILQDRGYETVVLMATDILAEGTQLMAEGNRKIVNRAFGIECTGKGGTWLPGVLSRKKQVAARILGVN
ncbi:MAG: putative manganese-dependent inorganic diphosphatase [Eggerthellaceae bacterium]|nr:putative manganese-dependent inorganic diphosphatase [Eggerthellaceae bacterium]